MYVADPKLAVSSVAASVTVTVVSAGLPAVTFVGSVPNCSTTSSLVVLPSWPALNVSVPELCPLAIVTGDDVSVTWSTPEVFTCTGICTWRSAA